MSNTTPLNPYFSSMTRNGLNEEFNYNGETSKFQNANEQDIVSSLIAEKIQQFGIVAEYIIRTNNTTDRVFGETIGSNFNHKFKIEVDMEDPTQGLSITDAIMPFGYSVLDNITIQINVDRFHIEANKYNETVGEVLREFPTVGDLIMLPLFNNKGTLLEIKYVNDREPSYVNGKPMLYKLSLQVFDLNSETFSSDNELELLNDIDQLVLDSTFDNVEIQAEADTEIIPEPNYWPTLLKKV